MENLTDFNFYIRFTKSLILSLPEVKDKVLAAAWVKRLIADLSEENVKVDYLKLLIFFLQKKKLFPPFIQHPNELAQLEPFSKGKNVLEHAKEIIEAETAKKKMLKESGDGATPFICDFSADLLEYVAIQDIPNFGVHGYFAVSKFPINTWDRVDKKVFPKAAKSLKEVAFTPKDWTELKDSPPATDSSVKFEESRNEDQTPSVSPKEDSSRKKKDSIKQNIAPPSRPIGTKKIEEDEDRKPPTWGSNLLEVKDDLEDKIEENVKFLSFGGVMDQQDESLWSAGERDSIAADDVLIDLEASNLTDLSFGTPQAKPSFSPKYTNENLSPKQASPISKKSKEDKSTDSRKEEHQLRRKTLQKSIADVVLQPTQSVQAERSNNELDHKLDEFGKMLDEIESQYRTTKPLKKETKDLKAKKTPTIAPTKAQRLLEAQKSKSIPKSHGASYSLEKSIHISPEAQLILEEVDDRQQMQSAPLKNLSPENLEFEALEQKFEEEMKKRGEDPHHRILRRNLSPEGEKFEALEKQIEEKMKKRGKDPHRRILRRNLSPEGEEFEALEEQIEEEMKKRGEDPRTQNQKLHQYARNKADSQLTEDHALKTISLAGKDKRIASVFDHMSKLTEKIRSPGQSKAASVAKDENMTVLETEPVDENVNLGELLNSLASEPTPKWSKPALSSKDYKKSQRSITKKREDGLQMIENLREEEAIGENKHRRRQYSKSSNLQDIPESPPKQQLEDSLQDYEMLEQRVEEEMKHQGQDPEARSKHLKRSKKQMREGREKYIKMRNKIDDQLQELEGADPEEQKLILDELEMMYQKLGLGKRKEHRTPPIFSKHKKIRDIGQQIRYPSEDGEVWSSGPEYFKNIKSQQSEVLISGTSRRQEPQFFGGIDLHEATNLDDIDMFDEELPEFSPKVPQKVVEDLGDMVHFYKDQGKAIPAMAGVPITVPRMSSSPRRCGYDEFGLPLLSTQISRPQNLTMEPRKRTEYVPPKSPEKQPEEENIEPTEEEYFRQFSPDHFKYKVISPQRTLGKLKPLQKVPSLHHYKQDHIQKAIDPFEELEESLGIFEETPPQLESLDSFSEEDQLSKKYNIKTDLIKRKLDFEDSYSADENEVIDEEINTQIEEVPKIQSSSAAKPQQYGYVSPLKTPPHYFGETIDSEQMPEYYSPFNSIEDSYLVQDEKIPEFEDFPEFSPAPYPFENEEFDKFTRDLLEHEIAHQPSEKMARYSRRQVPKIRKFQTRNVERFPATVPEEPSQERAYLLRQQIEDEVEAELAKQHQEFVGKSVLDESLPSGLASPLRPKRHVPFYETPPKLKRPEPIAKTPKKFDAWPSEMINVIQKESPPDFLFDDDDDDDDIEEERGFLSPIKRRLFEEAEDLESDGIFSEDIPEDFALPSSPLQAEDIEAIAQRQYDQLWSPVPKSPTIVPRKTAQAKPTNIIDFKYHETKSGGPVRPIPKHRELLAVDIDREVLQDLGITIEDLHEMNLNDVEVVEAERSLPVQVDPETAQCVANFFEDIRNVAFEPRIEIFLETFQKAKPGWKIFRFGQTLITILNNIEMRSVAMQIMKFVNDPNLEKIIEDWHLIEKLSLHPMIIQITDSIKKLSQNKQIKILAKQAYDHLSQLNDKTNFSSRSRMIKRKAFPQSRTGNAMIVLLLAAKLSNLATSPFVKKTPPSETIESKTICDDFLKKYRATRNHNDFRILFQALYTKYKSNSIDPIKGQCRLLLQNPHIQATLQLMESAIVKTNDDIVRHFENQLAELTTDKNIHSDLNNLKQMLSEKSPKQFLNIYTLLVLLLSLKNGIHDNSKPNQKMGKALAKNFANKLNTTATNTFIKAFADNLDTLSKNTNLNNLKNQIVSLSKNSTISTAIDAVNVALNTPNLQTLSNAFEQLKKLKSNAKMREVSDNLQKFIKTQEEKRKGKIDGKFAGELAPIVILALHKKDDHTPIEDRQEIEHQSEQEAIFFNLYYKTTQLLDNPILKKIVSKLGEPGRDLHFNALIRKLRYLSQDPLVKFSSSKIREKNNPNQLKFILKYWPNLVTDTALLDAAKTIQSFMDENGTDLDQQTIVLLPLVVIALAEQASPKRIKGRRRKMATEDLSRLPGVQETEEEYIIGPKGWDMKWEMPAEERVEFRAPNIKVLPPPEPSSTYKLKQTELEEPPLPNYIPLKRLPFDYKKLEFLQPNRRFVEENRSLDEDYRIGDESPPPSVLPSPPAHSQLQSELRFHQVYDTEKKLLEREVSIEGGKILEDSYKATPVTKTLLPAKSLNEILSEADRQYQSLFDDSQMGESWAPAQPVQPKELSALRNRAMYLDETPPTPFDEPHFQVLEVSVDVHESPVSNSHKEAGSFLEAVSPGNWTDSLDRLYLEDEIPEELRNFKWMDVRDANEKPRKDRQ